MSAVYIYNHEFTIGLQCEAEIDECLSDPCNSEGTEKCLDLDNKFYCQCREGYTGPLCEVCYNQHIIKFKMS